jgi:hypothetical protein
MSSISYLYVFQLRLLSALFSSFSFVVRLTAYVVAISFSLIIQAVTTLLPSSRDTSTARSLSTASPKHQPLSPQEGSERFTDEKRSLGESDVRSSTSFGRSEDDKDAGRGAFYRPLSMRYHPMSPSLVRSPSPRPTDSKVIDDLHLFKKHPNVPYPLASHARPTQHADQVTFLSFFAGATHRNT